VPQANSNIPTTSTIAVMNLEFIFSEY